MEQEEAGHMHAQLLLQRYLKHEIQPLTYEDGGAGYPCKQKIVLGLVPNPASFNSVS